MRCVDRTAIGVLTPVLLAAAVACGAPGAGGGFGSPVPGSDNSGGANTSSSGQSSGGRSSTGGAPNATGASSGGTAPTQAPPSGSSMSTSSGSSARGSASQSPAGGSTAGGGASPSASSTSGSNPTSQPAMPVQTTSFSTVQIPVAAGAELVKCQNFQNPIGKDAAIVESDSNMTNSHHMFVFHDPSFNQNDNAVSDCSGIEFHDLLHMAQTPQQKIPYPTGVGRVLPATEGLRVLVHLLNPGATDVTAQVTITFQTVAPNAVSRHAVSIFLNQVLLTVPPGTSDSPDSFTIPSDALLMTDVSHMHSRATNFNAVVNETGDILYQGTQWNEPVVKNFNPALLLHAGNNITWTCSFNNTTGMTLTFGESANTNEMCILAGIVYPATAGVELGTSFESVIN